MANWIGLLKNVPWGEVVGKAPQIAEGAKSLWGAVARRVRGEAPGADDRATASTSAAPPDARLAAIEAGQRELHAQLVASAELIDALAEQNRVMVERVNAMQRKIRWLGGLAVLALLLASVACLTLWRVA